MPSFKGAFKDWDIDAIMWYMKSISTNYHGDPGLVARDTR